ncbi:peptidyl-prolyl cis-trans isomerase FKBP13, chloroplastic-like [Neltuma alba]|uniref:peptidyl-prolyl cis-trans isomerase FKBP13, chloroplastic n=1 Tax=Neltuma alba TaxID=207710 RepID=UPI0010A39181|nr:peptidyl-prolyl cis-trans isomerase FKBP13, chloroplastic-like [Prosopis alba]XP_028758588.1 peptidyl-prolyl cis-trans isomerase FKBP13, chloroplastic-like [Prosopis alba]
MITLPYSSPLSPASTCFRSKPKFSTSCFLSRIQNNDSPTKPSNFVPFSGNHPSVTLQTPDDNFKRREAIIGLAFGFGLCNVALHSLPQATVAAESAAPCELTVAASGIAFCDKVVGNGPQAAKGQLIKAHYVGKLENGKIFDSSYNRGKPLTFRVGVGEVIKGWDEGILGGEGIPPMLTGGKRTLKIPPELAYGSRGAGCRGGSCIIPPDSTLLFDVEFISKA